MRRHTLQVEITVPNSVTSLMLRDYVKDAVVAWGEQRYPDDPFFNIYDKNVTL